LRAAMRRGLGVTQVPCGSSMVDGYRATDIALTSEPSAIIAFSDYVAFGVLSRLTERDVAVPQDVSVTGFDDIPLSGITSPALTTATVHKPMLGQMAWQQLHDAIEGQQPGRSLSMRPLLVARASTAAPRARRRIRARAAPR
jgi:LacI family transcriptional regulator